MQIYVDFINRTKQAARINFDLADINRTHNTDGTLWKYPTQQKPKNTFDGTPTTPLRIAIQDYAYQRIAAQNGKVRTLNRSTVYASMENVTTPDIVAAVKAFMLEIYKADETTLKIEVCL